MYWRQVVSQSPTSANVDKEEIDHYLSVWEPLNQRILTGSSFSGNERNCCFLNTGVTGKDQFADVSAASALHHLDDSRSIAVTDWDHDGDLDIWLTNRTSPRIRFLRNDTPSENSFVSFLLQGNPSEGCPRDAYGARINVELEYPTGGESSIRSRSLHGGDSFLSQSSKKVHFGLREHEHIKSVSVRWPGSAEVEKFSDVEKGKSWLLVQSKGSAEAIPGKPGTPVHLEAKALKGVPVKATGRLKISWPQSVGELQFETLDGKTVVRNSQTRRQPTLYMCWASWCAPCLEELKEISSLNMPGLEVIALNIEDATSGDGPPIGKQREILDRVGFKGIRGVATRKLLGTLNQKHLDSIYLRTNLPLPVSFLVDAEGLLRAVYKGKFDVNQVALDVQTLDAKGRDSMSLSIPFPGRWSEEHLDGNPIAVARVYVEDGSPEDAITFLKYYLEVSNPDEVEKRQNNYLHGSHIRAAAWYELAMIEFRRGNAEQGYAHCEESLKLAPRSVPVLLAMISYLATNNEFEKAAPYCESSSTFGRIESTCQLSARSHCDGTQGFCRQR